MNKNKLDLTGGAVSRRSAVAMALATAIGLGHGLVAASARIDGPLKIVLPFGPGSGTDVYARLVAQQLGAALGIPAVVDNRAGANGMIAAEAVAHAKPDGSTLLFTTNTTHAGNPNMFKDLRYDPVKDFAPISKLGNLTFFVVVPSTSVYTRASELVAAARSSPGTVSYGAANSFGMISGSRLGKSAGVQFLQVPYKSSPQIIGDLLGGQIQFAFIDMAAAAPLLKGGKLRALAVLADKRFPLLPNVPTLVEAGYPDFNVVAWFGLFAPAGTPAVIVDRINTELLAILAKPDLKARGAELGIDIFGSTPQELDAYVKSQILLWSRFVSEAGLKPE